MILYVNENHEIKDVNTTDDPSLIPLEVIDGKNNPFNNWSVAKICCYRVSVIDGVVTMMTPYIDSKLIEHIDQLGKQNEITNENSVVTTETVDSIMTDMLPELELSDENIIATIDSILTDIIPSIVGE